MAFEITQSLAATVPNRLLFNMSPAETTTLDEPCSICCNFNADSTNAALTIPFATNGFAASNSQIFGIYLSGGAAYQIQLRCNGTNIFAPGITYEREKWFSVCGVAESSSLRHLYVDGVCAGTTGTTVTFSNPQGIYIAGTTNTISRLVQVSECALWNAALTPEEVLSYSKGIKASSIRPESLIFYAPLVNDINDVSQGRTWFYGPGATTSAMTPHTRRYG